MASRKGMRARMRAKGRANSKPVEVHRGDFVIPDEMRAMLEHWDDVRLTSECLHCKGTGRAPGDGDTACGFCEADPESVDRLNR